MAINRWFCRNLIGNVDGFARPVPKAGDILRLVLRRCVPTPVIRATCRLPRCRAPRRAESSPARLFHRCRRTLGIVDFPVRIAAQKTTALLNGWCRTQSSSSMVGFVVPETKDRCDGHDWVCCAAISRTISRYAGAGVLYRTTA